MVPFARYLEAKKSVDDLAINQLVFGAARPLLRGTSSEPIHLLELGTGVGTMIERLLEWQALDHVHYTALDADASLISLAQARLTSWAQAHALSTSDTSDRMMITLPRSTLEVKWVRADLAQFLKSPDHSGRYDLILAHQLLDLLPLERDLPRIAAGLRSGGCAYLTLNFDGVTAFEPVSDADLEAEIIAAYHSSMDERGGPGTCERHSLTGRRLLSLLPDMGFELLTAGASDWIIHPGPDGYRTDDRTVLEWMLLSVEGALRDQGRIAPAHLERWVTDRRAELRRRQLSLIVHQIDVLARKP